MSKQTLFLIRHAEKVEGPAPFHGVDEHGDHDKDNLSVRGWQRAGALAALFADPALLKARGLMQPAQLYACAVAPEHASKRSEQTLAPLAQRLGLPVRTGCTKGQESALAAALDALNETALVCWTHSVMPALLRALAPHARLPDAWPDERYDLVWRFTRKLDEGRGDWRIVQIGQMLLAGDSAEPIPLDYREPGS
jgi:hypothetical protein